MNIKHKSRILNQDFAFPDVIELSAPVEVHPVIHFTQGGPGSTFMNQSLDSAWQ